MISNFGISLYLSTGIEENRRIVLYAKSQGYNLVFTSFHISEEKADNNLENISELIKLCKENEIFLCADVSAKTLEILGISSIEELYNMGLSCVRFDYGISIDSMVELSKKYIVMINASNLNKKILALYKGAGMNFKNVIAAHNFYPKAHTGLGLSFVKNINTLCHSFELKTLAFIPGFVKARGPIFEFLPTIEAHRNYPTLVSLMEHRFEAETDYVLVGDVDYDHRLDQYIKLILSDEVLLEADISNLNHQKLLFEKQLHNRTDLSDDTIRIIESRSDKDFNLNEEPVMGYNQCEVGDIVISNILYKRYKNEVEIVQRNFDQSGKLNLVGKVDKEYLVCLKFIGGSRTFRLINRVK